MGPAPQPKANVDATLKPFSCLVCRQRKVRCDRASPCGRCVRDQVECAFVPPVRGKRRRTRPPREGMHAKLRRYEEMLRTRGVGVDEEPEPAPGPASEEAEDGGLSEDVNATASPVSLPVRTPRETEPPMGFRASFIETPGSKPKLVNKGGNSRYYENSTLWSSIGEDFRHPDEFAPPGDADENGEPELDLFLGSGSSNDGFTGQLCDYHPPMHCLHSLKDIFVDRIDPLMKILHMPTFWSSVLQAADRRQPDMPKSTDAAIFCFYFSTISVLEEEECEKLFRDNKKTVFARYRAVARHVLKRVGLLSTTSPMTLRAFCFFMMGLRGHLRHDSQYILCGIALRLALKMGLHRDGKILGLSIFETEMRRRLWWHIAHLDFRTADLLGTRPSLDIYAGDAGVPWNVEDEDLHPEMSSCPKERKAITPIIMCLVRCDLMTCLQYLSGAGPKGASWGAIGAESTLTTAEKDAYIDEMEDAFESKYLRYCDPARSLDVLVSCMIRAAVCNMRLFAHNPRRFALRAGVPASEAERDLAFRNAAKLLEYASLVGENTGLRRYEWRINTTYLWDKILYVLIEARHRRLGADVDRLWALIGRVFAQYPDAFGEASARAVYAALSGWTLEVWDGYVAARRAEGMTEPEEPGYIRAMRKRQGDGGGGGGGGGGGDGVGEKAREGGEEVQEKVNAQDEVVEAGAGFGGFSNLESFEMNLDEWVNWEQLLSEQNGLYHVGGF